MELKVGDTVQFYCLSKSRSPWWLFAQRSLVDSEETGWYGKYRSIRISKLENFHTGTYTCVGLADRRHSIQTFMATTFLRVLSKLLRAKYKIHTGVHDVHKYLLHVTYEIH